MIKLPAAPAGVPPEVETWMEVIRNALISRAAVFAGTTAVHASTTYYGSLGTADATTQAVSEAQNSWLAPRDGVILNLHVYFNADPTNTWSVTVRKNAADSNLSVSGNTQTLKDIDSLVSVSAGDRLSITGTGTTGASDPTLYSWAFEYVLDI